MSLNRTAAVVGVVCGTAAALVALACWPSRDLTLRATPLGAQVLVEDQGAFDELVFHFVPSMEPVVAAMYRDFLPALERSVRLVAVIPDEPGARERLQAFLASLPSHAELPARVRVVETRGPISVWSKDRALVLSLNQTRVGLLVPSEPSGHAPLRVNDWATPAALARAMPERFQVTASSLRFDAGDFTVTGERVLADVNLFARNASLGFEGPEAFTRYLKELFGTEVLLLGAQEGDVPRHHMSMYLAPLGRQVLVGDPSAARAFVADGWEPGELSPDTGEPLKADFSEETQRRFDRAADELARAGFEVVRIPTVAFDDKTYLAYTNGLYEVRGGRKIAYVPVFGLPALDEAALTVYRRLGWEVREIHSRAAVPFHGTIGCVVNVLSRRDLDPGR